MFSSFSASFPAMAMPWPLIFLTGLLALALWRLRRARRPADRNPGPEGGYALIGWSLRRMPPWFNRHGMELGAWIAVLTLPRQRANSCRYLRQILGRTPTLREVWAHFHAFTRYLILRLDICCCGRQPRVRFAAGEGDDLRALISSREPALYGTLHLGHSDLVGFLFGTLGGCVHMIRKRVGNSEDTDRLARRYAGSVVFIWINDWKRLIFAMNDALRAGHSLAMQCDRPEYSSKREAFRFLGERRLFPFTIYHLSIMHGLPVSLSFAVPDESDPEMSVVRALPIFRPRPDRDREENFAAAREHFQAYLDRVEDQLRRTPYLWFNFTPLNPPAPAAAGASTARHLRQQPVA